MTAPVRFAEYTLHHVVAASDGGGPFDEQPAHKVCNARHGGQLGAKRSRRDPDDLVEPVSASAPPRPRNTSGYPKVWEGAIRIPLVGPVEVHHAAGGVNRVARGQRFVP